MHSFQASLYQVGKEKKKKEKNCNYLPLINKAATYKVTKGGGGGVSK